MPTRFGTERDTVGRFHRRKEAFVRVLGVVLIVVGILAIALGVLYLTQTAGHLPTFVPGYIANAKGRHTTRGVFGIALGIVFVVIGGLTYARGRR
jgi:hypothetical protein